MKHRFLRKPARNFSAWFFVTATIADLKPVSSTRFQLGTRQEQRRSKLVETIVDYDS